MDKNFVSGNSKVQIVNLNSEKLFEKSFEKNRIYFFYKEIIINKYLSSIANDIVAKPIYINRSKKRIYYPLMESANNKFKYNNAYLELIKRIHIHNKKFKKSCLLYADQPLINSHSISEHINFRVQKLLEVSTIYEGKFKKHILEIKKCYKNAIKPITNHNLSTEMKFSHADSGLHNCILDCNDKLYMADLEHSGIDSPIKQLIDYLVHPRNQADMECKDKWCNYFFELIVEKDLKVLKFYSSLIILKWALITLNEYLPQVWKIRLNSKPERKLFHQEILEHQLQKSIIYLNASIKQLHKNDLRNIFKQSEKIILSKPY